MLQIKWKAQSHSARVLSRSVKSDSLWPHGLKPTRLRCPWDFPSENTGVGCHVLLQGIFLTWGSNPGSLKSLALTGSFFTTESPGKPASTHCDQPHPKCLSLCPPPPDIHTFTTTSGWCYCQSPDLVDTCKASSPLALPWHPVLPLTIPSLSFFFYCLFVWLRQVSVAAHGIFVASCKTFHCIVWTL